MRDRFFYPLAIGFIAVLITYALSLGGEGTAASEQEIIANGFVIAGEDLSLLTASPGTIFTPVKNMAGAVDFIEARATQPRDIAPPSAGVFGILGPEYEKAFADKEIKITVTARQAKTNPAQRMEIGYFTTGAGDSGWIKKELTTDFTDHVITFRPGLPQGDPGNDYIGVWPAREGLQHGVDIKSMTVMLITSG